MKRTVMGSLVVLMVCTTVCTSFAEGELVGKWSTTGMNCYGTVGVSILTLTLTWQDTFYQANLVVFTVAGTVAYETSGIAYATGDVLVCLFREAESARMDVLLFEGDTLTWQWSAIGSDGEYAEDTLQLLSSYERTDTSEDL